MKLRAYDAPHIRHQESTRTLMVDAMLAILFIYIMAVFYYGPRAILLGLASALAALVTDCVCTLCIRGRLNLRDLSPLITGFLIPLFLPATIDYYVVIVAAVFGILVAKAPFGGVGHNVFNPAAAGIAFAVISFTDKVFAYSIPNPTAHLPLYGPIEITTVNSPAFTLALGGVPNYDLVDMALGNFPGPMGATNILVILACLLYLVFRGTVNWRLPACFFAAATLLAFLFPRGGAELGMDLLLRLRLASYEVMSGCLLLGGVLLLGDPVTTPKRSVAKVAFGLVAGVVVMLFRRYGGMEEELPFAVLLMNAFVWGFDMLGERYASHRRRKRAA